MTPLSTKLKELRTVAENAHQGEWTTDYERDGCLIDHKGTRIALTNDRDFASFDCGADLCRKNAAHIAAFNPEVALKLIYALEQCVDALETIKAAPFSCPSCDDGVDPVHCICDVFDSRRIASETLSSLAQLAALRGEGKI